jgi:hypothetical protein
MPVVIWVVGSLWSLAVVMAGAILLVGGIEIVWSLFVPR